MANIEYEQTFVRIARDTILQEAGKYEAPKYWVSLELRNSIQSLKGQKLEMK